MSINYKNPKTGEAVEICVSMTAPYAALTSAVENALDAFSTDEDGARGIISRVNHQLKFNACAEVVFSDNPLLELVNKKTYGRYTIKKEGGTLLYGTENIVMCKDKETPNYIDYKTMKNALAKINAGKQDGESKTFLNVDFSVKETAFFKAVAKFIAKTATDEDYARYAEMGDNYALLADTANKDKAFTPPNENRASIINACYAIINDKTGLDVRGVGVVFNNLYKTYAKRDGKTATDSENGNLNAFISQLLIEYTNSHDMRQDKIKSVFNKKKKKSK